MATTTKNAERLALEIRRTIKAPRERVFQAWTQAEELKRWSAPAPANIAVAEVDLRVGGRYRITMRKPDGTEVRVGGVYRTIEPPKRLVYTWRWENAPEGSESLVTVEFREQGKATEVVLRHEGLTSMDDRQKHEHGWVGCLDNLEALAPAL